MDGTPACGTSHLAGARGICTARRASVEMRIAAPAGVLIGLATAAMLVLHGRVAG
jgi:hypothetical protein